MATGTPPRRSFGQHNAVGSASPSGRPTSVVSTSSLSLATSPPVQPLVAAPQPTRARSTSTASAGGAAQVAERAQQWLSALAPRGEGRGREFLANTLVGVASVASSVGQEVNGYINQGGRGHSRPNSFSASSPPDGQAPLPFAPRVRRDSRLDVRRTPSPPPMSNGRKAPAPANLSRLGREQQVQVQAQVQAQPPPPQVPSLEPTAPSPTTAGFPRRPSTTPIERQDSNTSQKNAQAHARKDSITPSSTTMVRRDSTRHGHARTGSVPVSSVSPAPSSVSVSRRAYSTPYKIGFQPSGVRCDRTTEFLDMRKANGAEREREEGRLGRRWAKLVDLHFNPTLQQTMTRSTSSSFSLSSLASARPRSMLSLDGVTDSLKPKEVWRGLKAAAGPGPEESRKRAEEQRIVKWEADAEVRRCRICAASFTLSTRKHHCRLCGRIVCSLPPTPPALLAVQVQLFATADTIPPGTRRDKCSLLLVADYRTGRGEEVEEGFVGWMSTDQNNDDGIRRRRSGSILSETSVSTDSGSEQRTIPLPQQPQEVQVKGVRVCRDCWDVVSRRHKMADRARVTPFARLYATLRALQGEIEAILPSFEEEVISLQQSADDSEPSRDLLDAHGNLVALLQQYDAVAKRIAAAPADSGGSQASVQGALARSAAEFLAKAFASVQEVPRLQRRAAGARAKNMVVVESGLDEVLRAEGVRDAEDVARNLQPLLEQQAQLESFIAEANAQRKYDDARSLSVALGELEGEIARLTASALNG